MNRQKKQNIEPILHCKGTRHVLENEATKYNINVPIKLLAPMHPALNVYQILKSDKDKIDHMETSGMYRIECNKDNKTRLLYWFSKKKEKKVKN